MNMCVPEPVVVMVVPVMIVVMVMVIMRMVCGSVSVVRMGMPAGRGRRLLTSLTVGVILRMRVVMRRAGGMVRVRAGGGGRRLRHVGSLRVGGGVPVASERCPA
ncbi:hypothetical protein AA14362_0125 [Acetobacter cerevisiae DSM 14362]|nr:hypothetical protein AA14362_0125 [Acetobacter cerevisiae DSM 14362]